MSEIKISDTAKKAANLIRVGSVPSLCTMDVIIQQAINEVTAEKDAEIERLQRWVNKTQSGIYINCVYCGECYGPDDEVPATMADILTRHIEQCPKHPMSALKAEIALLREALAKAKDKDDGIRAADR